MCKTAPILFSKHFYNKVYKVLNLGLSEMAQSVRCLQHNYKVKSAEEAHTGRWGEGAGQSVYKFSERPASQKT